MYLVNVARGRCRALSFVFLGGLIVIDDHGEIDPFTLKNISNGVDRNRDLHSGGRGAVY